MHEELQRLIAALRVITLRAPRLPNPASSFSTTGDGAYKGYVGLILLIVVLDGVVTHAVLGRFGVGAHVVAAALHFYVAAWFIGDMRLMIERTHAVTVDSLLLRLGVRWTSEVPLVAIASVRVGEVDVQPGKRLPKGVVDVTSGTPPNVTLSLRIPATLRAPFGRTKHGTTVRLYVDRPDALATAIRSAAEKDVDAARSRSMGDHFLPDSPSTTSPFKNA